VFLSSRIQRLLPGLAAALTTALLLLPILPTGPRLALAVGLVSAAAVGRRRSVRPVDATAVEAVRQQQAQALLDAALSGRGPGHALHLRSEDGSDPAVEGMIAQALRATDIPLLGITTSQPTQGGPQPGPRLVWHQAVARLMDRSRLVVVTPLARDALRWEVCALRSRGLLDRTIFRMPPATDAAGAASRWEAARRRLLADGLHLPPYSPAGCWFRLCPEHGEPLGGVPYAYAQGLRSALSEAHSRGLPHPLPVAPVDRAA